MGQTTSETHPSSLPRRLGELDFQDLYISRSASHVDVQSVVRGRAQLTALPPTLVDAVARLRNTLRALGSRTDHFFLDFDGTRLRVQRVDTVEGPEYVCKRVAPLPSFSMIPGIPGVVTQKFMELSREQRKGLMLFAGGMAAGSTTTMLSLMRDMQMADGGLSVVIEEHTERKLQGRVGEQGRCIQICMSDQTGDEPISRVAARTNPSMIVISELGSEENVRAAVDLASDGHMVMATIRATDPLNAINQLINRLAGSYGPERARDKVAQCLLSVWWQEMAHLNKASGLRHVNGKFVFPTEQMRTMIRTENAHGLKNAVSQQWMKAEAGRPIEKG